MSFVTAARDYVEFINANFDSFYQTFGREMTLFALIKGTILYLGHSIKIAFLYIVTLKWLHDLAYLPILIPEMTRSILLETFRWGYMTRSEDLGFFGVPTLLQNKFVVGFLNSFFASLPFTFGHFLSLRQFYVNGWRTAASTSVGMLTGHLFFLAAVLFGWRPILIPWLQYESLSFLIAVFFTYALIRQAFGRNAFKKVEDWRDAAKNVGIGFLLMVCDQGLLFKYINTLTLGLEPSYLEPVTGTATSLTQQHLLYIFGFCLGNVCFTFAFFSLAWWFRYFVTEVKYWTDTLFAGFFHRVSRIALLSILLMHMTFYGLDFVFARPLGYVPYDRSLLNNAVLTPYSREDNIIRTHGLPTLQQDDEDNQEADTIAEYANKFVRQPDMEKYAATKSKREQFKKEFGRKIKIYYPLRKQNNLASFDRSQALLRQLISTRKYKNSTSVDTTTPEAFYVPTPKFWIQRRDRRYTHAEQTKGYNLFKFLFPKKKVSFYDQLVDQVRDRMLARRKKSKAFFDRILWRTQPKSPESTKPSKPLKLSDASSSVSTDASKPLKSVKPTKLTIAEKEEAEKKKRLQVKKIKKILAEKDAQRKERMLRNYRARLYLLLIGGSRDIYNEFIDFNNRTSLYDPYDTRIRFTPTQNFVLQQIEQIWRIWRTGADLGLSHEMLAGQEDKLDAVNFVFKTLLYKNDKLYQFEDRPFYSRFATVENMTSKIFKGQYEREEWYKSKPKLSFWPGQYHYLNIPPTKRKKAVIQRVFQQRLRENPLVKVALRADIDSFVKRQPKEQRLSPVMESELFAKRILLKNMMQTKTRMRRMFHSTEFAQEAFAGPKSFSNRVYNHQFKGTYKVVRQLFRTDFDKWAYNPVNRNTWEQPYNQMIMKYDMPLYKDGKDRMTSLHEDLFKRRRDRKNPRKRIRLVPRAYIMHRTRGRPLYAGWDGDRRAFVITNRFLPTRVSGRILRLNESYPQFASLRALAVETKGKQAKKSKSPSWSNIKRLAFTTWPLSSKISQDPLLSRRPSVFMADHPNRSPSILLNSPKTSRVLAVKRRLVIEHFNRDFNFERLEAFATAAEKTLDIKVARRSALYQLKQAKELREKLQREAEKEAKSQALQRKRAGLPPVVEKVEKARVYFSTKRWPSGFIIKSRRQNVWWLQAKPPRPFVDRGGYVWPGHEQLKINMWHYLPRPLSILAPTAP